MKKLIAILFLTTSFASFSQRKKKVSIEDIQSLSVDLFLEEGDNYILQTNDSSTVGYNFKVAIQIVATLNDGDVAKTKLGDEKGELKWKDFEVEYTGLRPKYYGTSYGDEIQKMKDGKSKYVSSSNEEASRISVTVWAKDNPDKKYSFEWKRKIKPVVVQKIEPKKVELEEIDLAAYNIPLKIKAPKGATVKKLTDDETLNQVEIKKGHFYVNIYTQKPSSVDKYAKKLTLNDKLNQVKDDTYTIIEENEKGFVYEDDGTYGFEFIIPHPTNKGKFIQANQAMLMGLEDYNLNEVKTMFNALTK